MMSSEYGVSLSLPLVVILFILLIIIGAVFWNYDDGCYSSGSYCG
jgi:uncharacterized protein (TIGR01732 family)